ncbi:hypothetical protein GGTG_13203 [Gaeumannomyces tritici R3-111a-1]|uniref:Uncharacterized protein n=1 Tax=Gaeumannomyces tritici (strain R3-111a-1) TaxID=644352 RepID=J3PI75_GAET3|nr:hypothetical protein GGTG_13203 [Gaeumannomyces tritici R3-111a-1]EJT69587.1 hypothetical protein GGTG_13203 [Gaeumannomyces tritici R3-111a-1]
MRAFLIIAIQLLTLLFQPSSLLAAAAATTEAPATAAADDGTFYIVRRPVAQQPQPQPQPQPRSSLSVLVRANTDAVAAFSAGAGEPGAPAGASTRQSWGNPGGGQWNCVVRAGYEYCGDGYWGAASPGARAPALWVVAAGFVGAVGAMAAWS